MKRNSTVLTIASGKGGVGKSVIAVNLAEALASDERRVALVDADLGQGAGPILLNETPAATVWDQVQGRASMEQVRCQTEGGLTLVQGADQAGSIDGQASKLFAALDDVLAHLRHDHDVILIDAPAGTEGAVRWALDRADRSLLVLVGEPTAIADAYRLAKLIWKTDPSYPLGTVVNFSETEAEAQSVAERFGKVTERFTQQTPDYLGWVPFSAQVRQSVARQTPVVRTSGPARDAFTALAEAVAPDARSALAGTPT